MKKTIAVLALLGASACTQTQMQTAGSTALNESRLFCGVASASGSLTVALQSTGGSAILAKGNSSAYVNAACALINAIPVSPPVNPSAAPVVTVNTPTGS